MKKIVLIIAMLIIDSCATYPKIQKLNSLQPGITRAQLAEYLGSQPISTQLVAGYYLIKYKLQDSHDMKYAIPHYFVFGQNDSLIGWEEVKGQDKIVAGGVSILIPFPSRP